MREEVIGLQECFELSHRVLHAYASKELEGLDSTVEVYLLNFWTKELSYRDLCDRINHCVTGQIGGKSAYSNFGKVELDVNQLDLFNCLLQWFAKTRMFPEKAPEESWEVSDLRKLIFLLCTACLDNRSHLSQVPRDIYLKIASKCSPGKFREFIEVQMIQKPEVFQRFAQWLDNTQSKEQSRIQTAGSQIGSQNGS